MEKKYNILELTVLRKYGVNLSGQKEKLRIYIQDVFLRHIEWTTN